MIGEVVQGVGQTVSGISGAVNAGLQARGAKAKKKKVRRRIIKKLTPEQKAKRKARLKKLARIFLWLNPASQPIMAAKLIRDKRKARKAKKAQGVGIGQMMSNVSEAYNVSISEEGAVDNILENLQDEIAQGQPLDAPESSDALDNTAEIAAEPSESVSEDNGEHWDWAYAEGDIPTNIQNAINKAKAKANALKSAKAKSLALSQIAEIEKDLKAAYSSAKSNAKSADVNDAAEISKAIKASNPAIVAASLTAVKPEKVESKPKDEKESLGEPTDRGIPNWVIYGGGALVVAGIAYFIFSKKGSSGK